MDLQKFPGENEQEKLIQQEVSDWIAQRKSDLQKEIQELSQKVTDKEQIVSKQNNDLQESYSKYIHLSATTCEASLSTIISTSNSQYLTNFRDRIASLKTKLDTRSSRIQQQIQRISSISSQLDNYLNSFEIYEKNAQNNLISAIKKYEESYLSSIESAENSLIIQESNSFQLKKQEELKREIEKLQKKVDKNVKCLHLLENSRNQTILRVLKLSNNLKITQNRLYEIGKDGNPLPKLTFYREIDVDIPPASSKQNKTQSFKNLVVLAPIRHFGKQVFKN